MMNAPRLAAGRDHHFASPQNDDVERGCFDDASESEDDDDEYGLSSLGPMMMPLPIPTLLPMDMPPPSTSSTCDGSSSSSVDDDDDEEDEEDDFITSSLEHYALSRRTSLLMTEYEKYIAAMDDDEDSIASTTSSQRGMDPPEEKMKQTASFQAGLLGTPKRSSRRQMLSRPRGSSSGGHNHDDSPASSARDYAQDVLGIQSRNRRMSTDFDDIRSSLGHGGKRGGGHRRSSDPDGVVRSTTARSSLALKAGRRSSAHDGGNDHGNDDGTAFTCNNDFDGSSPNSLLWDNDDRYRGSGREFSDLVVVVEQRFGDQEQEESGLIRAAVGDCRESRLGRLALVSTAVSALLAIVIGVVATVSPSRGRRDGNVRLPPPASPYSSSSTSSSSSSSSTSSSSAIQAFHRSDGWHGRTYDESVDFCSSRDLGLCSYDAICPFGPGGRPAPSAAVVAKGVAWVAHAGSASSSSAQTQSQEGDGDDDDAYNSWVQVGPRDLCLEYDFMHGRKPRWGLTADDDDNDAEGLTEHVLCCPSSASATLPSDVFSSSSTVARSVAPETASAASKPSSPTGYQDLDPEWYSSPTILYTYEDAWMLCSAEERFPCPYESYCPDGPHRPPIHGPPLSLGGGGGGGSEEGTTSASSFWAPVVDERGHGMLRLDDGDGDVCRVRYTDDGNGEDGVAFPETRSRHVMCCSLFGEEL